MQRDIKEILYKGKSENANPREKREMSALFHQSGNEYDVKRLLLEELQNTEIEDSNTAYFKNLFSKIWSKIESLKPKSKSRTLYTLGRVAAAVVIGLLIGYFGSQKLNPDTPVYYSAYSPKGSVSEMTLPDGSKIVLNADSEISYSINGENNTREVFLNGEAWFDVQKNEKKPFIVHTPAYDVNVTGTRFNVKAYDGENNITTTLEEGSVILNSTDNCKLEAPITLNPGEQVILDTETKQIVLKEVKTQQFTSWKDNMLIIDNMSLKEVEVLLERRYGVEIEIQNEEILDNHLTATIKNETIIDVLEYIKLNLNFNYKIIDQKIEITAKR